jgi:hypothetical protein
MSGNRNDRRDNRRDNRRRFDNKRPFERREKLPPKVYGKDVKDIDLTKMKKVNVEAIERSKFNNMLVKKLSYYNKSGI